MQYRHMLLSHALYVWSSSSGTEVDLPKEWPRRQASERQRLRAWRPQIAACQPPDQGVGPQPPQPPHIRGTTISCQLRFAGEGCDRQGL